MLNCLVLGKEIYVIIIFYSTTQFKLDTHMHHSHMIFVSNSLKLSYRHASVRENRTILTSEFSASLSHSSLVTSINKSLAIGTLVHAA